jgi:predicted phage tail protein
LEILQSDIAKQIKEWDEQQKNIINKKQELLSNLESEIDKLEKQSTDTINMLTQLYNNKLQQVQLLSENILFNDELIKSEKDKSNEIISNIKKIVKKEHKEK